MKYYCPNCDELYEDWELHIRWGDRYRGDEEVCPRCGEFEELMEAEYQLLEEEENES